MMNKPEILAPAGAKEQLKAAVACGTNAVYLGTENFNARRNADNFGSLELNEAVKYCHLRNVKVYVTLNTLIFDRELESLYETVKKIAQSGADAVLVQDFAAIAAVKRICPELPLHVSTQMAVHNASGAKLLEKLGFSRIVLAREMSLAEIKTVREAVSAELEVFVHGAHCMSASGNCYLSAALGERSGNRGLCAQGCRLDWRARGGREYALSLKDMSYIGDIKALQDIGIESFKIEGRMKRPEYVAAAVTSLKNALDGKPYDSETLKSVFSRNGFTDGYLKANRNIDMFGYRSKDDVVSAEKVFKSLGKLYQNDRKTLTADFKLTLKNREKSSLTASCGKKEVTVTGAVPEAPIKAPLSKEIALRNISKLGDTPFLLGDFQFSNDDLLTLSASAVNDLRRRACDALCYILTSSQRKLNSAPTVEVKKHTPEKCETRVRLSSISQAFGELSSADMLILQIDELLSNLDIAKRFGVKLAVELPDLFYPQKESALKGNLAFLKENGVVDGVTGNIGGVALLKSLGFTVHGAHGLNITNSASLEEYRALGLADATVSFEASAKAIGNMTGDTKRGAIVYGYLPLMLMRSCPQKTKNGCGDCSGRSYLTDRRAVRFPVVCHNKEYSVLHNSVPLYVGEKNMPPLDFYTLYFTVEAKEECADIFKRFLNKQSLETQKTNGLYFRELL